MSQLRDVRCSACGETYQAPGDEDRCRLCGETGKLRYLGPAPAAASTEPAQVLEVTEADAPPQAAGSINVLAIVGGLITVIGVILFIGNVTGLLPTFPAAGYLTILIGGAIASAGAKRKKA